MNASQKGAWFIAAIGVVALIGFLTLVPFVGFWPAHAAFGLFGLGGLVPLLFRDKAGPGGVTDDERDKAIARRATLCGAMCSYGMFYACLFGTWVVRWGIQREETVTVYALTSILFAGAMVFFVARSVALLVYYARGVRCDEG